jgi:hypothetical protein
MIEYWSLRRRQALQNCREAHTAELREIHFRVAEHCRALEQSCVADRRRPDPFSCLAKSLSFEQGRPVAVREPDDRPRHVRTARR